MPYLGMFACLTLGWILGRSSSEKPWAETTPPRDQRPARPDRITRQTDTNSSPSSRQLKELVRRSSSDQIPGLLKQALLINDRLEQREIVTELCKRIDSSNWQDVFNTFKQVTAETGIQNEPDWELARMMCARNVGQPVIDHWLANDQDDNLTQTFWYWSQSDPTLAKSWLEKNDSTNPGLRDRLLHVLVGGTTQNNPDGGRAMMQSLTPQERTSILGHFVWNLRQSDTIDGVVDWAAETAGSPNEDQGYIAEVTQAAMNEIISNANVSKSGTTAGKQISRLLDASADNRDIALTTLMRMEATTSFEALESLASNSGSSRETINTIIQELAIMREGLAQQWISDHPESELTAKLREIIFSE